MRTDFCAAEYKTQILSSADITSCPKVPVPQIGESQNYIFISYSHEQYKAVYADLADMYEAGVRFWYDKDLSAGKKWHEEVLEKISDPRCVGVIFYICEDLFLSRSANREIEITYNLTKTCGDGSRIPMNHFSVNLTNKLPIEILSSAMHYGDGRTLDMHQIAILSQMFPDDATYICYDSADHKSELISQIRTQFGVIDTEEHIPLRIDQLPCSVYIGTVSEKMACADRLQLVSDIQDMLGSAGISSYVQQDCSDGVFHSGLTHSLQEYTSHQNTAKLDAAQHVLILTTMLGWSICARCLGEFDPTASTDKTILYLIDDNGGSMEYFQQFYHLNQADENDQHVLERVFFLSDYKDRLLTMIQKSKAE